MTRLHNPGPGEMLDRLTILALKIVYGAQAGKSTDHFESEQNALVASLGGRLHDGSAKARVRWQFQLQLGAVNAALWQAEDEMRRLRALPEGSRAQWTGTVGNTWIVDVANAGIRIQMLNDRRAELIHALNLNAGLSSGTEKLT